MAEVVERNQFNSLTLFQAGLGFAKRHYMLTAFYIVGLLLAQFATGFTVTTPQRAQFEKALSSMDLGSLERARENAAISKFLNRR